MTTIPRITSLSEPPKRGRIYLVPTIEYEYYSIRANWPVFLPKHEDAEQLNFFWPHYHVDPRFVSPAHFKELKSVDIKKYSAFQRVPLMNHPWGNRDVIIPHPPVVWRRLTCRRADLPYYFRSEIDKRLTPAFAGRQCKRARTGWVCPHKHYPLGSHAPVDGVITCPLHGLRINAQTGVVMAPGEIANSVEAA